MSIQRNDGIALALELGFDDDDTSLVLNVAELESSLSVSIPYGAECSLLHSSGSFVLLGSSSTSVRVPCLSGKWKLVGLYEDSTVDQNSSSEGDDDTNTCELKRLYPLQNLTEAYAFLRFRQMPKSLTYQQRKQFRQNTRRRFFIDNEGFLCRQLASLSKSASIAKKLMRKNYRRVPTIRQALDLVASDHAKHHEGHNRAEKRLSREYYIPNLRQLVIDAKNDCSSCMNFRPSPKTVAEPILTTRPLELVMADLTFLPFADSEGYKVILLSRITLRNTIGPVLSKGRKWNQFPISSTMFFARMDPLNELISIMAKNSSIAACPLRLLVSDGLLYPTVLLATHSAKVSLRSPTRQ